MNDILVRLLSARRTLAEAERDLWEALCLFTNSGGRGDTLRFLGEMYSSAKEVRAGLSTGTLDRLEELLTYNTNTDTDTKERGATSGDGNERGAGTTGTTGSAGTEGQDRR